MANKEAKETLSHPLYGFRCVWAHSLGAVGAAMAANQAASLLKINRLHPQRINKKDSKLPSRCTIDPSL
jgi:hypothetical protein